MVCVGIYAVLVEGISLSGEELAILKGILEDLEL